MNVPLESTAPVFFNGVLLPPSVYWMELVSVICPGVSPETREWLLDLHYCGGVGRKMASSKVMFCADETERVITDNQEKLRCGLAESLPGVVSEAFVKEWLDALRVIKQCAKGVAECTWNRESFVKNHKVKQMLDWLERIGPKT